MRPVADAATCGRTCRVDRGPGGSTCPAPCRADRSPGRRGFPGPASACRRPAPGCRPACPISCVWQAAQLRSRIGLTSRKYSTFLTPLARSAGRRRVLDVPLACRTGRASWWSAAASSGSGRRPVIGRAAAVSSKSVGFWLWAWQPPQSVRISPGRTWCQVWAMFSTMPFLSSVWKVQATSAGILARKLVSGLPSGSSGCSAVRFAETCGTGNLAEDAQPFVGDVPPAALCLCRCGAESVVGSVTRMRMAWMSLLS